MKKLSLIVITLILAAGVLTSCDPCASADCGTQGGCTVVAEEAVCLCTNGYEKDDDGKCEVRSSTKYVGAWAATESCTDIVNGGTFTYAYDVNITESAAEITRILLAGLGELTCSNGSTLVEAEGTVTEGTFVIDQTTECDSWTFVTTAATDNKGTYDTKGTTSTADDVITVTYHVKTAAGITDPQEFLCIVTMVRK